MTTQSEDSKEGRRERRNGICVRERNEDKGVEGNGGEGKRIYWSSEAPCVVFSYKTHSSGC